MENRIVQTTWAENSAALIGIRERVFIVEQHVSLEEELDGRDDTAIHFLMVVAEQPIGCARVLLEQDMLHIGRVAILAEYRGQHLGSELMRHILRWCRAEYAGRKIYLHAQTSRIAFYERLGFAQRGDVFMDAGIPHLEMWYQH